MNERNDAGKQPEKKGGSTNPKGHSPNDSSKKQEDDRKDKNKGDEKRQEPRKK